MSFLSKLQEKPYQTRIKILWGTVLVVAVLLVGLFVFNLKSTLQGVDGKQLLNVTPAPQNSPATTTPYAAVERVERTDRVLKIYFNFLNSTNDILSISKLSDITLTYKGGSSKLQSITDRQNKPFVQKILSHSQNFGILTFQPINTGNATLTFDQLYFEKDSSSIFSQSLELNLDELSKPTNLRN